MNAQMRATNDKWIQATLRMIKPDGFWCWTDEKEIFWRKGADTKFTASTKRGLEKLRYVLSKEGFQAAINPVPEKYVHVPKENTISIVMP